MGKAKRRVRFCSCVVSTTKFSIKRDTRLIQCQSSGPHALQFLSGKTRELGMEYYLSFTQPNILNFLIENSIFISCEVSEKSLGQNPFYQSIRAVNTKNRSTNSSRQCFRRRSDRTDLGRSIEACCGNQTEHQTLPHHRRVVQARY